MVKKNQNQESGIIVWDKEFKTGLRIITKTIYENPPIANVLPSFLE